MANRTLLAIGKTVFCAGSGFTVHLYLGMSKCQNDIRCVALATTGACILGVTVLGASRSNHFGSIAMTGSEYLLLLYCNGITNGTLLSVGESAFCLGGGLSAYNNLGVTECGKNITYILMITTRTSIGCVSSLCTGGSDHVSLIAVSMFRSIVLWLVRGFIGVFLRFFVTQHTAKYIGFK